MKKINVLIAIVILFASCSKETPTKTNETATFGKIINAQKVIQPNTHIGRKLFVSITKPANASRFILLKENNQALVWGTFTKDTSFTIIDPYSVIGDYYYTFRFEGQSNFFEAPIKTFIQ